MRQLETLQGPLTRRQATRLPEDQCNEDSDSQGTEVAKYGEPFSRSSSEFFPMAYVKGLSTMVFSG